MTFDEYLALDDADEWKSEFVHGEIREMPRCGPLHGALCAAVMSAIYVDRAAGWQGFASRLRLRVLATGRATYADSSFVRGALELDPADANTVTNPMLIVEVLAPESEAMDRGERWHDYQQMPSLQEYVLVGSERRCIERFRRTGPDRWEYRRIVDGAIELVVGSMLDVADVYEGLIGT